MAGTQTGYVEFYSDDVDLLLPLPEELGFDTDYNWEAADTGLLGFAIEGYKKKGGQMSGAMGALGEFKAGDLAKRMLASATDEGRNVAGEFGTVVNPKSEILFRGTKQREFQMDFSIAYKSAAEMSEFFTNLNSLYRACAPTYGDGSVFLNAPKTGKLAVFGPNGDNIIRQRECAIKRISTNLTPDQIFATYASTGMPVHVKLSIVFIEMEIPTKDSDEHIFF